MGKMTGYMLTWTIYGTWLQGDEKGYVKDGKVMGENPALMNSNIGSLVNEKVLLTGQHQEVVHQAIIQQSIMHKQRIYALSVASRHVHLVLEYIPKLTIERAIWSYKYATNTALVKDGFKGKVWTRGYDVRYCFDEESLRARVGYVRRHCD